MAKGGRPGDGIVNSQQQKTINRIANQTRNLKNEQYRMIDENGNVVITSKGGAHSVETRRGDLRDNGKGSVSIHNHPQGGTFSEEDFRDFGYGAKAVYAAAPEGTYSLVNKKYGTKDAYKGWYDMKQDYIKNVGQDVSYITLKNRAQATKRYQAANKKTQALSDSWVKAKKAGKPKSVLDKIYSKYNVAAEKQSKIFKEEVRKAEWMPAHKWLQTNAGKYGFAYSFKPFGKK